MLRSLVLVVGTLGVAHASAHAQFAGDESFTARTGFVGRPSSSADRLRCDGNGRFAMGLKGYQHGRFFDTPFVSSIRLTCAEIDVRASTVASSSLGLYDRFDASPNGSHYNENDLYDWPDDGDAFTLGDAPYDPLTTPEFYCSQNYVLSGVTVAFDNDELRGIVAIQCKNVTALPAAIFTETILQPEFIDDNTQTASASCSAFGSAHAAVGVNVDGFRSVHAIALICSEWVGELDADDTDDGDVADAPSNPVLSIGAFDDQSAVTSPDFMNATLSCGDARFRTIFGVGLLAKPNSFWSGPKPAVMTRVVSRCSDENELAVGHTGTVSGYGPITPGLRLVHSGDMDRDLWCDQDEVMTGIAGRLAQDVGRNIISTINGYQCTTRGDAFEMSEGTPSRWIALRGGSLSVDDRGVTVPGGQRFWSCHDVAPLTHGVVSISVARAQNSIISGLLVECGFLAAPFEGFVGGTVVIGGGARQPRERMLALELAHEENVYRPSDVIELTGLSLGNIGENDFSGVVDFFVDLEAADYQRRVSSFRLPGRADTVNESFALSAGEVMTFTGGDDLYAEESGVAPAIVLATTPPGAYDLCVSMQADTSGDQLHVDSITRACVPITVTRDDNPVEVAVVSAGAFGSGAERVLLRRGTRFPKLDLDGGEITIVARPTEAAPPYDHVLFFIDGVQHQQENLAPFAIEGGAADDLTAFAWPDGPWALEVAAFNGGLEDDNQIARERFEFTTSTVGDWEYINVK